MPAKDDIMKYAVSNASEHGGKASLNSVIGKVMAEYPELRGKIKELREEIQSVVEEVNRMADEKKKSLLNDLVGKIPEKKKVEKKGLEDLQNIGDKVVMRLAPSPSGPLHLGHTRMAVLNDEYVKRYGGKLILRFEDTNPLNVDSYAYDRIPADLDWLGVKCHDICYQSDNFPVYYKYAKELLEIGKAYICLCENEKRKELKANGKSCPHRDLPIETQIERWDKLMNSEYEKGEAAYLVKTDQNHPNPAIRDFVAFRMLENANHPRTGDKYHLFPLMDFAVAVDDHTMGLTHVIRGKDHLNNTYKQKYIYDYFGWKKPEFYHYGWVTIDGTLLKTSTIKQGIKDGKYSDWSDVRLGTLQALEKRGIRPEAIRRYWLEMGLKAVDIRFSWKTLFAYNKDIIDKITKRYFFVWNSIKIKVNTDTRLKSSAPCHPTESLGTREYEFPPNFEIYLCKDDWVNVDNGKILRLKDLCNIEKINDKEAKYIGNDLEVVKNGAKIVQWVPINSIDCKVLTPDGEIFTGYAEPLSVKSINETIQFERFGFVRIEKQKDSIIGYLTHK